MQQATAKARSRRWWQRRPKPEVVVEADPERIFLDHLPLVERVASQAARRSGFGPEDVEDCVATVRLKLIDDDYAILRRHRGTSKMSTYLHIVAQHAFQDWRQQKWGRYRPSAAAKRLGPLAIQLEQHMVRDQLDLDTAIQHMLQRVGGEPGDAPTSAQALHQLAAQLPARVRRTMVGEEALEQQPSPETASADRRIHDSERRATAEEVYRILKRAMRELEPKQQLILQMFYADGCKGSAIARALGMEQRGLYTHKDRGIRHLRRAFDAEGLTWDAVRDILGWVEAPSPSLFVEGDPPESASKEDTP